MAPIPIPSKPWTDLGCSPEDLVNVVGAVVRQDIAGLADWFRDSPDATQVVEILAARHRVGPFLTSSLDDTLAWGALPETARIRLRKSAELQSAAAEICLQHLAELDGLFGSLSLPFIVLKGPELGIRFGSGAASRGYRDIDILVQEKDRRAVCGALEASGYHRLSRHFLSSTISARFNHATDYKKEERLLDLHWCISRLPGLRIDGDELFRRAVRLEISQRSVQVLCPSDELLLLLLSSFADIQRGYLRLQPFVDIAKVAGTLPADSWDDFFERGRTDGTDRICRAVLNLVVSAFDLDRSITGLDRHIGSASSPSQAIEVLLPSPGGRRAKQWALRYLPVGGLKYLLWWTVSLPFRSSASHPYLRRRQPIAKAVS